MKKILLAVIGGVLLTSCIQGECYFEETGYIYFDGTPEVIEVCEYY